MKIGILTYHRSHNYGALLQALALRYVLSRMGHDVFYIDYFPKYHRRLYRIFDIESWLLLSIKGKIKTLIRFITTLIPSLRRRRKFTSFINKKISPFCRPITDSFDCVIYGSDQIWRKQPYIDQYNPFYFGANNIETKKHISYAASLDVLPDNEEDVKKFCELVSHLDKISVRENTIQNYLLTHGYTNVQVSLDPTLLLAKEQWKELIPNKRLFRNKYILFYDLLGDSGMQTFDRGDVELFAERNSCRLVYLHAKVTDGQKINSREAYSPSDFVNLIRNAECILTSSYHGVVLSILLEKPFYGCFPIDFYRAQALLDPLSLANRLYTNKAPRLPLYIEQINFDSVNAKLKILREDSLLYLTKL